MKTIEELENEIKNLSEELAKLKQEEKAKDYKRWRAKENEIYYYIDGGIDYVGELNSIFDNNNYETGNYFQTKEQAEKTLEKLKIYTQLKDLALRLNEGVKIDWLDPEQEKYHIYIERGELGQDSGWYFKDLNIHCLSKDFLDIAKQEIDEENLLKLFEED